MREGDLQLASRDVHLGADDRVTLDLRHRPADAVRRSIAARVPTSPGLINFSEALGDIPDSDLNLWLDVLGASRIVADPLTFSKLRDLPLADFRAVTPNRSVVYVLSAQPAADRPRLGIGPEPTLTAMRAVPGLDDTFESYVEVDDSQVVRVWGDTAVVTALLWVKGSHKEGPFDYKLWFSDTYARVNGQWRYVFGQASTRLTP